MKKIKTYIVFADYFISGHIDVYYIGKSKRAAREEFRRQAFVYLTQSNSDSVKLRISQIDITVSEHEYLMDVGKYSQSIIKSALDSYEMLGKAEELGMINHLTFMFDCFPYWVSRAKISTRDFMGDGQLDKLIIDQNPSLLYWLNKYLNKNF